MKRKICTFLLLLAFAASAAIPAAAASHPSSLRSCTFRVCGETFCLPCIPNACGSGSTSCTPSISCTPDVPETPSEPDTPPTPDVPSEPDTPSVPDEQPSQPTLPDSGSVPAYEREVMRLVNIERAKYGLAALLLREDLCRYARIKSQDMHDSGYFSHTSPNYGSPFDMMQSFGITYSHAGENIAMGYSTPEAVVQAWMNSEGHRANIFSSSYTSLGVGYVSDGGYWTQWFVG